MRKQLGTSPSLRFLLMHGEQPRPCLAGCSGQARLRQERKLRYDENTGTFDAGETSKLQMGKILTEVYESET